jgi:hypothetical protein
MSSSGFGEPKSRSPLKSKPLRNPGQSLDEEIQRYVEKDIDEKAAVLVALVMVTLLEWWRWWFDLEPNPVLWTIVSAPIIAFFVFRLVRARKRLLRLRMARDGEKAVGQFLDTLRKDGHVVLHDIVGSGFNLDHVLIGPKGVFAIETKTRSKPAHGQSVIHVNDLGVRIGNGKARDESIIQAAAQRNWLRAQLKEMTGHDYRVRSVLLYPGWFVERSAHSLTSDLWVLNPKALPTFIGREPDTLPEADQRLVTYHLSRFVRMS